MLDRWRRFAGVRVRTAVLAAVAVGAAMALGSAFFVFVLQHNLRDDVDAALQQQAQTLASTVSRTDEASVDLTAKLGDSNVEQVLDEDGHVLAASPEVRGQVALSDDTPGRGQHSLRTQVLDVDPDATYRVLALGTVDGQGNRVTVVVAQSLEPAEASSRITIGLLAVGSPLLMLFVALLTYWLSGRALRPVEDMRQRVASIDAANLDARVALPRAHDEVWRLAGTMNGMLERLDGAAQAQRQFVSDASHELRSPLAALRASVEVAVAHPETGEWPAEVVLEEAARIEHLVADLLLLANADERGLQLKHQDVDLDDILTAEAQRLRTTTGLAVSTTIAAVRVRGDRDRLARVVRNLVDNAVRHAASSVELSLSSAKGQAVISVSDDGDGVQLEDRERVFERFVRLDDSRSRAQGGTGLGLAIVSQVVRAHHGTVAFVEASRVEVRLPQAALSDDAA